MTAPAERWSIAPYFIVDDVVSAAAWYRDVLGFSYERLWGEPPAFCMVCRSGIVSVVRDLCDQAYGCRDFEIDDWNGYRLCFGQNLNV